jgi:hypothetical protein
MSQPAKAQEPSMEEILASIRRIIADDDGKPAKAAVPAAPKPAAAPEPPPPPPPPKPAVNTQEDVDAMLADLEPAPPAPEPEPVPEPEPEPPPSAPDVLVLTEEMAAPEPPSGFRTIEAGSDVVFSDAAGERSAPDAAQGSLEESAHERLLSNATALAVDNAFNSLAHTILGNNARTLEDLVKDMLRPMLKTWLDDNLPGLVERIVRAEIERVSRGR